MIDLSLLSVWGYKLALAFVMLSILFCFLRMVFGPTFADRVVALDLTMNVLISIIALYGIISAQPVFLDVVIALALIIFLSTVSFAQFIARQSGRFLNRKSKVENEEVDP